MLFSRIVRGEASDATATATSSEEESALISTHGHTSAPNLSYGSSSTDTPEPPLIDPNNSLSGPSTSTGPGSGEAEEAEPSAATTPTADAARQHDEAIEDVVTSLTRRVRCLFSIITWPIVPLGTIASLALGWLIYASFVMDVGKTCSHPLHWYAIISLVLVIYAPYHGRIRSYLFSYQRERGSERPPGVRRYDQLFHTLALIYVYAGITLVQTCKDDISVLTPAADASGDTGGDGGSSSDGATAMELDLTGADPKNTCAATCPNLFAALRVYVATIEIFTFSLILPLLFLPCVYLFLIRRTLRDAESLAALQDRFREEEAMMRNGGVTAEEIMQQFEKVSLIAGPPRDGSSGRNNSAVGGEDGQRILVIKQVDDEEEEDASNEREDGAISASTKNTSNLESAEECNAKECCICMESFYVGDEETGNANVDDPGMQVIRTKTCKHYFHHRCMASWVGGRWSGSDESGDNNNENGESSQRARRTTCPLCRQDVRSSR